MVPKPYFHILLYISSINAWIYQHYKEINNQKIILEL